MSKNYLSSNDLLLKGDYLMSNNGQWKAVFQDDGNFVIYGWKPMWASDTDGSDAVRLVMQSDCNLVMYNQDEKPKWHTNSYQRGSPVCRLKLTDDGKLLVFNGSSEIWSSAKSRGMK